MKRKEITKVQPIFTGRSTKDCSLWNIRV